MTSGEYFRLQIVNETTVSLIYNIGNGARNIELSLVGKQVNDRSYHTVTIYHNMKEFGLILDDLKSTHQNPLFLKRDLDLENKLYVGSYPYDPTEGFVGCIRGLVRHYFPCYNILTPKHESLEGANMCRSPIY